MYRVDYKMCYVSPDSSCFYCVIFGCIVQCE